MKIKMMALALAAFLGLSSTAFAQESCPEGKVCVDKEDFAPIVEVLKEKKCLTGTPPTMKTDPIVIVTDRQGRVYASGSDPVPFTVHLDWCDYSIDAKGQTKVTAAEHVDPTWGFRFRPKAMVGILGTELIRGDKFIDAVEAGALLEPFYFHWVNLNGFVGIRSFGGAVGFDLTKNLDIVAGYSVTYEDLRGNPFVGVGFALWYTFFLRRRLS